MSLPLLLSASHTLYPFTVVVYPQYLCSMVNLSIVITSFVSLYHYYSTHLLFCQGVLGIFFIIFFCHFAQKFFCIVFIYANYGLAAVRGSMHLPGVDNRPVAYSQKKADNRLCVYHQIETPDQPTGGCISGTEKNESYNLILSGQNNPEVHF